VGQQLVVFTQQLTVGHSVSLTLQELLTAFDASVIVSRLIIQNVVTVCKVLAKMCNCEGNCRLYLTIREHFLTLISTFYFIILNFYSFMLFGYDAKPTAGTPVDRVYEIALDNVCN
jgi:hypothetical protein